MDKRITIDVPETEDQNLFLGLMNANEKKKATRFVGTRRIGIKDESAVQVLVSEVEPVPCPLAIKITKFRGTILHVVPLGTDEVLETKSRERARQYLKQVEGLEHISDPTKVAWKTAFSCGQINAFFVAISILPLLDVIFGVIKRYQSK